MDRRCPKCDKLVAVTSDDFDGDVALFCGKCKATFGSQTPDLPRLGCRCGKWLHNGAVTAGTLRAACSHCRVLVEISADDAIWLEVPIQQRPKPQPVVRPRRVLIEERIVTLIEERWELFHVERALRRVEVAVGLRFDVFNRDGFRCVYCGRGPADGVLLEVDHVIARSAGGPDTLANLVTACQECNRGKSDKVLAS